MPKLSVYFVLLTFLVLSGCVASGVKEGRVFQPSDALIKQAYAFGAVDEFCIEQTRLALIRVIPVAEYRRKCAFQIANVPGKPIIIVRSYNAYSAFNNKTGELIWRRGLDEDGTYVSSATDVPVITADGRFILHNGDRRANKNKYYKAEKQLISVEDGRLVHKFRSGVLPEAEMPYFFPGSRTYTAGLLSPKVSMTGDWIEMDLEVERVSRGLINVTSKDVIRKSEEKYATYRGYMDISPDLTTGILNKLDQKGRVLQILAVNVSTDEIIWRFDAKAGQALSGGYFLPNGDVRVGEKGQAVGYGLFEQWYSLDGKTGKKKDSFSCEDLSWANRDSVTYVKYHLCSFFGKDRLERINYPDRERGVFRMRLSDDLRWQANFGIQSEDSTINFRVYDMLNKAEVLSLPLGKYPGGGAAFQMDARFTSDGKTVAVALPDGKIYFFRLP